MSEIVFLCSYKVMCQSAMVNFIIIITPYNELSVCKVLIFLRHCPCKVLQGISDSILFFFHPRQTINLMFVLVVPVLSQFVFLRGLFLPDAIFFHGSDLILFVCVLTSSYRFTLVQHLSKATHFFFIIYIFLNSQKSPNVYSSLTSI